MADLNYVIMAGQGIQSGTTQKEWLTQNADFALSKNTQLILVQNHHNNDTTFYHTLAPSLNSNSEPISLHTITGATNATPIVVTTSASHSLSTGDRVSVKDVLGNTNANTISRADKSFWTITVLTATTFELDSSVGNATYTSGGEAALMPNTFGYDVSFNQKLLSDHSGAVGAVANVKYTSADQIIAASAGSGRWDKTYTGEAYDSLTTAVNAMVSFIPTLAGSPTPNLIGIIITAGYVEAVTSSSSTYKAELEQFISDLRTDFGSPTTPIVLEVMDLDTSYSSIEVINIRQAGIDIANADSNILAVFHDDLPLDASGIFMTGTSTIALGTKLATALTSLVDGTAPSKNGRGTIVYLGHSQAVGAVVTAYITAGDDDSLNGGNANVMTYEHTSGSWAVLDGSLNSNTFNGATLTFGPDVVLARDLLVSSYPSGVMVFKAAVNASSVGVNSPAAGGGDWLKSSGTNYTDALTNWELAKLAAVRDEGVMLDVRAVVLHFGENSTTNLGTANFKADMLQMIADVRVDYKTSASQDPLRIYLVKFRLNTATYDDTKMATIRKAQEDIAAVDKYISIIDTDDLSVKDTDNLHYSGESTIDVGQRIAIEIAKNP